MECFSHDMGPVVRMVRLGNPNEIDEYVNPFCTELDEIGSFQSYCIGHFEHEWLDALGQMIAEGRVPIFLISGKPRHYWRGLFEYRKGCFNGGMQK